jgi:hypothetical protein
MPLGKLIYMPEESTPTIATEGNREAVAYLELGANADHYGRLFVVADELLKELEDLAELVEAHLVHGDVSSDAFSKALYRSMFVIAKAREGDV